MDVTTVLSSIKTATEIAKLIKNSVDTLEKAESKLKLADLISALAEAKIQVTEIQQILLEKDAKLKVLQEQLTKKEMLQWESPYYWLIDGTLKDGPFCQHCYDKNLDIIRLQGNGKGFWECKACKNSYKDKSYNHNASSSMW
ncbi:MAG TPA: hypothetical protein VIG33_14135 [Pseudobdellovibrionaceae bacterium]|jgi:hypothetical protein